MKIENGGVYYINFKGNEGREINNIHLGVIYKLPSLQDVVFCIPLTSTKPKHFNTIKDFNTRNYREIKHYSWQYLKQTDSIALLDQMRIISINRIIKCLKINNQQIKLNQENQTFLKTKITKYIQIILYKNN